MTGYMNPPEPSGNQAYIQKDSKTGIIWVHCPKCGKRNFIVREDTIIKNLPWKCKASDCRKDFEVNTCLD